MGVIRYGTDPIAAVLDSSIAGRNVSEWLPGQDIPAVATLAEALALPEPPDTLLIGIAPTGGQLPDDVAGDDPRGDRRRAARSTPACTRSSATTRSSRPRPRAKGVQIVDYRRPPERTRRRSGGRTRRASG